MQGNGEQKGGLKDRIKTWFLIRKKKKRQKQLEKIEKKERERQLKIKNSQVFSNQSVKPYSKKKTFAMVSLGFFLALFEPHTIKKEEREKKKFQKKNEEAPVALLDLKIDVKQYTESLNRSLEILEKEIDTLKEVTEKDKIKTSLNEKKERMEQVKEKYDKIKERHQIQEKISLLGLSKSKEVIVPKNLSEEAKQSILATTAFITASLEKSEEKLEQVKTELEVKEKEMEKDMESKVESEVLEDELETTVTIHTNKNEKIEVPLNKPFTKKVGIARPKPAIDFLKKQTKFMKESEERIDEIHRLVFQGESVEKLDDYFKELDKMYEKLNHSLIEYKTCQEKYGLHNLIAFEDIRKIDTYRLTVSDLKIREILRHTSGEKENVASEKAKQIKTEEMKQKEVKEQEEKKEKQEEIEKEVNENHFDKEDIEKSLASMKALLEEQENQLKNFHMTLSKTSPRAKKMNHFGRLKGLLKGFVSMSFGAISVLAFKNPMMKALTGGFALNSTVKNLRRAIHPETPTPIINFEELLHEIDSKESCLSKTVDLYSSTLTEIEWLKEDFEKEFKAYQSIYPEEYMETWNRIEDLRKNAERELEHLEREKRKTKSEKQKVLKLGK